MRTVHGGIETKRSISKLVTAVNKLHTEEDEPYNSPFETMSVTNVTLGDMEEELASLYDHVSLMQSLQRGEIDVMDI